MYCPCCGQVMIAWDRDGADDDVNNYVCVDCDTFRPTGSFDADPIVSLDV